MKLWITILLFASPPQDYENLEGTEPSVVSVEREAKALFEEGTALYASADYNGAVLKFTEALRLVQSLSNSQEVELDILFNIASSHERAYEIDGDLSHLRQALLLLERYAQEKKDLGDSLDAEARILRLKDKLKEETEETPSELVLIKTTPDTSDLKKGLGLTIPGLGSMAVGLAVLAHGSTFKSDAQKQVNSSLGPLSLPSDHPAWLEGERYINLESRKGQTLMGVGGAIAVTGIILTGVGTHYLVKSKRARTVEISPVISAQNLGLSVKGSF